jgi:hypothetical protein
MQAICEQLTHDAAFEHQMDTVADKEVNAVHTMDKLEAHAQGERPEKAFYQIGYNTIDSGDISHVIDVFYDALDSKDKYESEQNEQAAFTAHGIPFRMYIAKFNGGRYIADDVKEAHLKSCVFFVRNEDDNCLYAALFAALAYRERKVVIDNTEHTFDSMTSSATVDEQLQRAEQDT